MRPIFLASLFVISLLAGCLGSQDAQSGSNDVQAFDPPTFTEQMLIDELRAGGEPVIAILQTGTILVSAHPGWTHYHPSDDPSHVGTEILTPANGQSYLWRSTDNGSTWAHVNLMDLPVDNAPRSTALGVSDPEFTVMKDGTVCMTDLIALASSSTSCSHDDGLTWMPGNSLASGGVNDRQWLASYEDEFYFTANYFTDHRLIASTDYGLTWERRGNVPCNQDLIANPETGALYVGCGAGIGVSNDGGNTWQVRTVPNDNDTLPRGGQRIMAEPAIDAAGNVWVTWTKDERRLFVAGTPDEGATWPWSMELTGHFANYTMSTSLDHTEFGGTAVYGGNVSSNGSYVWPWISAGSNGTMAVTWIGSFAEVQSSQASDPWFLFSAFVYDMNTTPIVHIANLTTVPIHVGQICQSGTTCQVQSMTGNDAGDRRLGDFFETTIDAAGYLHATVSDTYARSDVVSHATYVKQTGGRPLLAPEDVGWMPTQG